MKLLRTVGVVLSCWCLLLASSSSGAADGTGASRLFTRGANLCKLVSTAKLKVATGLKLPKPTWNGAACRWEVNPGRLKDSVSLYVHRGLGRKDVESQTHDARRATVTNIALPGASYATLVTAGYRGMIRAVVAAVYPKGAVFVAVTAPGLTASRAIAAATAVVS